VSSQPAGPQLSTLNPQPFSATLDSRLKTRLFQLFSVSVSQRVVCSQWSRSPLAAISALALVISACQLFSVSAFALVISAFGFGDFSFQLSGFSFQFLPW
jgi:hypothetical protein